MSLWQQNDQLLYVDHREGHMVSPSVTLSLINVLTGFFRTTKHTKELVPHLAAFLVRQVLYK